MNTINTTRGHRGARVVAVGAVAAMIAVGCSRPGTPRTTTTMWRPPSTTTTTMGEHGGEHGHMPDRLNHPPTEQQKADAIAFIRRTRAAVKASGLTPANLTSPANHFVAIGDFVHYVKPEFARDEFEFDEHHIEAFAVINGQIAAAMYTMKKGKTIDDAPDIAGNWTMFHDHVLSYKSDDIMQDDYFRLFGPYTRQTAPMLHVWLVKHPCGPFAGTNRAEGSCLPEIDPDFPV